MTFQVKCKLPYDQVVAMRASGASLKELAALCGLSINGVSYICNGRKNGENVPRKSRKELEVKPTADNLVSHRRRKCLGCRKEIDVPRYQFMCKGCREAAERIA